MENKKGKFIWSVRQIDENLVSQLKNALNLPYFLLKVLVSKGFESCESIEKYLECNIKQLADPYLLKDMDKAVSRIRKAISNGEKIMIFGDYDVDGVTSVATLMRYLASKGANVDYYIPERVSEGYGLNKNAIDKFLIQNVSLIITVDSGITAHEEIHYANQKGIDVVVTDHHECRDVLPDAIAVINPHRQDSEYPFCDLAGVGVVFRLVCALEDNKNLLSIFSKYSDIVALGTVADVMPIIDENRVIVKLGLKALENTKTEGLKSLVEQSFSERRNAKRKNLTASSIGFTLAPRINAAGRIGDVNKAVALLTTDNKGEADNIALYLCAVNRERQLIENKIFEQAVSIIENSHDFDNDKVIVLASDLWHIGVIGIVASKLTERYKLPSILISCDNNEGKGSGRSVAGFNINEALCECKDLLIKYGGHELAAGLSIEKDNIDVFRKRINQYAKKTFDFDNVKTYIDANFEITTSDITVENAKQIQSLEPFGLQNPVPVFCIRNAKIKEIYSIGEGKHTKLILEQNGICVTAVYFGMPQEEFSFAAGSFADFMCTVELNDFRGNLTVQVLIKDVQMQEEELRKKENLENVFQKILDGNYACSREHIPELSHFKASFVYLKRKIMQTDKSCHFDIWQSAQSISNEYNLPVSSLMLNICISVFEEMGLVTIEKRKLNDVVMYLNRTNEKVILDKSKFLIRLRNANS